MTELSKRPNGLFGLILAQMATLGVAFWCYHQWLSQRTGVPTFPLYARIQGSLSLWILPPILIFTALLAVFRRLETRPFPVWMRPGLTTAFILIIGILFKVGLDLSVAMIDGGSTKAIDPSTGEQVTGGYAALVDPYTRKGLEYYWDVEHVKSLRSFLAEYVLILERLTLHSAVHPPGGVLFLYIVGQILGRSLLTAALSSVVFTSLTVVPIYLIAQELFGKTVARRALLFYLLSPNVVMFNATCMDGVFSLFPMLSVHLFLKTLPQNFGSPESDRSPPSSVFCSVLTGLALAFGMLLTFSTVFIGIVLIVYTLLVRLADAPKWRPLALILLAVGVMCAGAYLVWYWAFDRRATLLLSLGSILGISGFLFLLGGEWSPQFKLIFRSLSLVGLTFVTVYFLLYLAADYNLVENLRLARMKAYIRTMKAFNYVGNGYESPQRYVHIAVANLAAFFICSGLPITTLWLREAGTTFLSAAANALKPQSARTLRASATTGFGDTYIVGYVLALVAIDLATLYTFETERIWIFMAPFVVIPAARHLDRYATTRWAAGMPYLIAGILFVQILIFEVNLYTFW